MRWLFAQGLDLIDQGQPVGFRVNRQAADTAHPIGLPRSSDAFFTQKSLQPQVAAPNTQHKNFKITNQPPFCARKMKIYGYSVKLTSSWDDGYPKF